MSKQFAGLVLILINIFSAACGQNQKESEVGVKRINFYYPNGQMKIAGWEKNGMKYGESKTYFENGQQQTENHWENGIQQGSTKTWFSNGKLNYVGQIKDGQESGEWKYYDDISSKYIYSVNYKNGEIVNYNFSNNKYLWRNINLEHLGLSFEFPCSLADSLSLEDGASAYWTMYPWTKKSDIEFYSMSFFPIPSNIEELRSNLKNVDKGSYKNKISVLFERLTDEMTPDITSDDFEISYTKETLIDGIPAFEIEIYFPELKVRFPSVFIFGKEKLFIFSAYLNSQVASNVKPHFFSSIKFIGKE